MNSLSGQNTWKQGDVFHWSYNDKELERRSHGNNGGTTYWCVSQIGIVDEQGLLVDTYWHGNDNRRFTSKDAEQFLELTFKGNLSNYRKAQPYERACYSDKDCLDLSRANNRLSDNFYVRKDAVHDLEKKRKIIQRSKKYLEKEIDYKVFLIERYATMLEDKSYEEMMSLSYESTVRLFDEDYLDEQST